MKQRDLFSEVNLLHYLFFALTLFSLNAFASEATLSHTVFGTSSQYHSKSWDLASRFDEKNSLVEVRHTDGRVMHETFEVNRVSFGYKFKTLSSEPVLRGGVLSRTYDGKSTSVPIATLRGEATINEKFFYNYQIGYVPMTEEFQTAFTVREILRGGYASLGGSYQWSEKFRSTYYFQHYFFNDDNTRMNHDVALFYGLAPGDPWIWVGVGAGRLSNTTINAGYWTPLEFYSVGPRLDISFSFFEKFRFMSGLNLNYFKDVKTGEGTGYYLNSRLTYKMSPTFELYTGVESIQSQQLGKLWKSNAISVGVMGTW